MTNGFHVVTSKVHFSTFTFLDFSATYDTNIQLLVEVHFFSWLPTPPTSSNYPTNTLRSSLSAFWPLDHHLMCLWFSTFCSCHLVCLLAPLKLLSNSSCHFKTQFKCFESSPARLTFSTKAENSLLYATTIPCLSLLITMKVIIYRSPFARYHCKHFRCINLHTQNYLRR